MWSTTARVTFENCSTETQTSCLEQTTASGPTAAAATAWGAEAETKACGGGGGERRRGVSSVVEAPPEVIRVTGSAERVFCRGRREERRAAGGPGAGARRDGDELDRGVRDRGAGAAEALEDGRGDGGAGEARAGAAGGGGGGREEEEPGWALDVRVGARVEEAALARAVAKGDVFGRHLGGGAVRGGWGAGSARSAGCGRGRGGSRGRGGGGAAP